MRGTFVYRDGQMVPKHLAAPLCTGFRSRSSLPAPMLISDTADAFKSMADGKMYDSKSQYRASLAAHGMHEIGNEIDAHMKKAAYKKPKGAVKTQLIEAYQKVRSGYKPPPAPIVEAIDRPDLD